MTDGVVCSSCGEVVVNQVKIEATGHTEKTVEGYEATCTEDGLTDGVVCSSCGEIVVNQVKIEATGHTEKIVEGYEATCTEDGLTDGIVCSVCDVTIVGQKVIYENGHNYIGSSCENCEEEMPLSVGLEYTLSEDETYYIVTGEGSFDGNLLRIPSEYKNLPVQSIGFHAFDDFNIVTNVVIPDSVTSIGEYAFFSCSNLTNVELPNSVISVGHAAFGDCKKMKYNEYANALYVGNALNPYLLLEKAKNTDIIYCTINLNTRFIASNAFDDCGELTEIVVPDSVKSIGKEVFGNCTKLEMVVLGEGIDIVPEGAFYNCSVLTKIKIPYGVKAIGEYAFKGCKMLMDVIMGNGVEIIEEMAFYDCTSLSNIIISNGLIRIGGEAFHNCRGLTSFVIHNKVEEIGSEAFWGCDSLNSVYIYDVKKWCETNFCGIYSNPLELGATLYVNDLIATKITIPDGTTKIGKYAFIHCESLTSIEIPNSVTTIGDSAFYNCTGLTSIEIPNSVIHLGNDAFSGCYKLKSNEYDNGKYLGNTENPYLVLLESSSKSITTCEINENTRFIHSRAFASCRTLESIVIPKSVTSIGRYAFQSCEGLVSMVVPGNVKAIQGLTFGSCFNLADVTIEEGVTDIETQAFSWCTSLKNINIPNSITKIGVEAFYGCTELENIIVSENNTAFKSIDGNLYSKDGKILLMYAMGKRIAEFIIPEGVLTIGEYAFAHYAENISVIMSNSIVSIEQRAFYQCTGLNNVKLSNNLVSIGENAFGGCTGLKSTVLPRSITKIDTWAFSVSAILFCEAESKPDKWSLAWTNNESTVLWGVIRLGKTDDGLLWCEQVNPSRITIYGFEDKKTTVTIPSEINGVSITEIKERAFANCSSLISIVIPDGIAIIGADAFVECTNLTIYCEVETQPSGWSSDWNSSDCTVEWNYKPE